MFKKEIYNQKMQKTLEVFNKELSALRTGRANANMLDLVKVDVYGQKMPINQLATITTPEPRTINIQVWDTNNVSLIDAAINKSELGLNPQIDGQLIRLPVPDLSEERRSEIKKIIKEYQIDGIVIGNPINMDGSDGPSSQSAKDLAKNLSKDITENITLWDERLSSQGAFNLSNELGTNSSKKIEKLDQNSAQFILQGVLDFYHKKNT